MLKGLPFNDETITTQSYDIYDNEHKAPATQSKRERDGA